MKELLTAHHICPTSRGGTNQTIVHLPNKFHQALHFLFGNMTGEESMAFLQIILVPGKRWTMADLQKLREKIKFYADHLIDEEVN